MKSYYAKRGALWERMALCGARPVAGDKNFGRQLLESLEDFIYGPGFTEESEALMRKMKIKMEREKIKEHHKIPIKYGRGGIVDIEFLAQKLKLKYGARLPYIQPYNTVEMLKAIEKEGWNISDPKGLYDSYRLLRAVETHIRMETGRGAETLPADTEKLRILEETMAPFHKITEPLADMVIHAMERAGKSLEIPA